MAAAMAAVAKQDSSIVNPAEPVMEVKNGDIVFKDVKFKYYDKADNYVLTDVDIEIKSGEVVGIIGSTGSGKSTLVSLISRFYDVNEGEVLVGGYIGDEGGS